MYNIIPQICPVYIPVRNSSSLALLLILEFHAHAQNLSLMLIIIIMSWWTVICGANVEMAMGTVALIEFCGLLINVDQLSVHLKIYFLI